MVDDVSRNISTITRMTRLSSKKDAEVAVTSAFASGSFVEFREKSRTHVGKIESVQHKTSGGARYTIIDSSNHKYNVPDKDVTYAMPCPNSVGKAAKLYEDLCRAQESPLETIQDELDVSPDLVQMAWEEAVEDETHNLTPAEFVELVHAHTPSAMEKYLAWKLLQSEMSHVFFKEIKDKGRVVSFKAKTKKSVDAAKDVFCRQHVDDTESQICFV
ncbi:hypothetical protein THAOC_16069 [Thalassiosira oceanica]|uniref:Ribonuclease II winged helix domain-containing protein n=1 Tax=Thalassiosira oceanica TaxID=159749 RepID=K0SYJ8_THAOC|nr:hypothetical protein THAOC_16069 [Thalassiosira oceanica]|eukprot:EJK63287.1 hypothetical protein THAOC_16069 [Thalassiosira oceanica]